MIEISTVIEFLKKMMNDKVYGELRIHLENGQIVLYIDKNYHKK